jgi:putative Ca2+/H+ antiporter (TMEM165/GDT1 family)
MTSIELVEIEQAKKTQAETDRTSTITESSEQRVAKRVTWSFWTVFSSTFLTIFLAEMGDKTQLATLLMSAESQSPWIVFAGSAAALIATSLLGVFIGYWIARRLSPKTLNLAVSLLLLLITGLLLGDVIAS